MSGQLIPSDEHHFRRALREDTEHCHFERHHQGLDNQPVEKPSDEPGMDGAVECRERRAESSTTTTGGWRDGGLYFGHDADGILGRHRVEIRRFWG